jgi:predicted O-methyltransferase YrrM
LKNPHLLEIPIIPEEYELSPYQKIDYTNLHSEMDEIERKFVNGLIRYYTPQNIIEIGVAYGGGSVNLLNAINDVSGSRLVSIDRALHYNNTPIGSDVMTVFSEEEVAQKWTLVTDSDPSTVLDDLSYRYDFAVIDTVHLHPIESLNFLCVLPYMNDGAIVVLHDTALYLRNSNDSYATRVLMCAVAAPKLTHAYQGREQNIIAFQINSDTYKYVDNIFDSLFLPWGYMPIGEDIDRIRELLCKHYNVLQVEKFDRAVKLQDVRFASAKITFSDVQARNIWNRANNLKDRVVFYGAGQNMRNLLDWLRKTQIPFEIPVWDKSAKSIGQIDGISIGEPDYETKGNGMRYLVITITDKSVAREVKKQFQRLGYTVFNDVHCFLCSCANGCLERETYD